MCTTCLVKQHNGHKVKVTDVYTLVPLTTSKKIKEGAVNDFSVGKYPWFNIMFVLVVLVVNGKLKLNKDNTY